MLARRQRRLGARNQPSVNGLPERATKTARAATRRAFRPDAGLPRVGPVERELLDRQSTAPTPKVGAAPVSGRGTAGTVLGLQRTAGNAAVASMVALRRGAGTLAPSVQREGVDDLLGPNPFGGGEADQSGGGGGSPSPTTDPGSAGGINELGPIARTGTLIADTVIASSYTPGAGNIW